MPDAIESPDNAPRGNRLDLRYRFADVRADDDGAGFDGHAATWWVVDSYGTALKPGAFKRTLKARRDRIPVLWQHWSDMPIGKPTTLNEDETGLAFAAAVTTETRAGSEAMALLRDGVPLGMSFGFQTLKSRPIEDADVEKLDWSQADAWYKSEEGHSQVRIIEEVKLWELSLVTFPANEAATVTTVRADADALSTLLDALRAGTLDEPRRALCAQIVAAYPSPAPEPVAVVTDDATTVPPRTDAKARRDRNIAIALALTTAQTRAWVPWSMWHEQIGATP